jgi:predicted Na+-dependent transporter
MMDLLEIIGNLLLFTLIFCMSSTVDVKSMKEQMQNKKAILAGIISQFFVMPFLGFLVVNALNLPHDIGLTLLIVTSSPGGSYSNWWCSVFNADLALVSNIEERHIMNQKVLKKE